MKDITQLLEEPNVTIAIVGAMDNPSKYGYVIYGDSKLEGFRVFPVNPNNSSIDGDKPFNRPGNGAHAERLCIYIMFNELR